MSLVGYRTYLVSILVSVFGVLEATDWASFLDNPGAGWVALFAGLVMAAMRAITTTPPGPILPKSSE